MNLNTMQPPESTQDVKSLPPVPDAIEPARRRIRVPNQTVVALIVLSVSAAALVGMRQLGKRSGMRMAIAEIPIDTGDSQANSEKAATYERIMSDLRRAQHPLDVALGEFGKSPFMLEAPKMTDPEKPTPKDDPEDARRKLAERERALRREKLQQAFNNLHLQSVMDGRVPLARINGEILQVGERVDGFFVVTSISGRAVELDGDGETFILNLDSGSEPRRRGNATPVGRPR